MTNEGQERAVRVLWVGNSYTMQGRLPRVVGRMVRDSDAPVRLESDAGTVGGKDWKWHFENPDSRAMPRLERNRYDLVVLQNHSLGSLRARPQMMEYGRRFVELVRERGAEPVFFCTWPRRPDRAQTGSLRSDWDAIRGAYEELARRYEAVLAPVGHAWYRVMTERPDLDLHVGDGSHPSAAGTYLAACVFHATFTGRSPQGLATRKAWEYRDVAGEWKQVEATLDEQTAAYLQRTAAEVRAELADRPEGGGLRLTVGR
ncbi:MAG: SGNH/GDSL hydrolase family protein [Planctomycetota bacterium]